MKVLSLSLSTIFFPLIIRLTYLTNILFQACDTGMRFTFVEDLRDRMPDVLMGCQLLKLPIDQLDRSKLTDVLKTAMAHDDIIVNCEEEQFGRMTMETATKVWVEVCQSHEWECKDFLIFIGGKGEICKPLKRFKSLMKQIKIEELQDSCPILLDTDWCEKLSDLGNKKRGLSEVSWSEESMFIQQPKKPDTQNKSEKKCDLPGNPEVQRLDLNSTLEQFRLQSQQMLEEQRQESERQLREVTERCEKRIEELQKHQEYIASLTEGREKQHDDLVNELRLKLQEKDHEKVLATQSLTELQNRAQTFDEQKRYWQTEMVRMRDLVQSSQKAVVKQEVIQEPTAIDVTFGSVGLESEDEDEIPKHSSPCRRKINNVSKGLPTSLGKLGISVFNPAKSTKIEYLSKFIMLVEDFNSAEDFKQIKQLLYQAFADDRNFRIQDLTKDDKSTLNKLAHAIIRQDDGDSIDLMKSFESEQLRHGETHLNYLHRVSVLYEFATEFSDEEWKKSHVHAQKIYNKIDDSLPTSARSKFRELMMEDRKNSSMTVPKIRTCLDTVLLIFGDELKSAMGSQRHVVPIVDAIQSKPKQYQEKRKEFVCWSCGSSGHMKRDCPDKGHNREPKTSGRKGQVQCFSCQGFGHISASCPSKQNGHSKWNRGPKKNQ